MYVVHVHQGERMDAVLPSSSDVLRAYSGYGITSSQKKKERYGMTVKGAGSVRCTALPAADKYGNK